MTNLKKERTKLKKLVAQFTQSIDTNELLYLAGEIQKTTDNIRIIASALDNR